MPSNKEQPKQRSRPTRAQTRARLLQAASEVFAERGYDRASLDEVAAAAGLTKGAVYSSFAGKDELFYALMAERIDERLTLVTEAVDRQGTPEAIASDAGSGLVGLISSQADWHLLFIEFWARAVRDPSLREQFARHRRAAREVIARFLEQQAAHVGVDLPAPADQLAVAVLALSNGIAIEHLADPETVDPLIFGMILSLLLQGLGAPTASQADVGVGLEMRSVTATRSDMVLRPLGKGDEAELLRIYATREVSQWWDVPADGFPWTDDPDATRLTIEVEGAIAGLIQFCEQPEPKYRHASIDLFLDPVLHGRGLGTEALRRIVCHLIQDRGHHRVTIDPAVSNVAAIRAYEKVGFRPVGIMRRYERDVGGEGWHDGLLMELLAEDL